MTLQLGLQLSSITPFLDTPDRIRESLRKVADMGYRYVQLQGAPTEIPDSVIVDALIGTNLECVATQEDYPLWFGDDPERAISRAVACRARYLTCALIPKEVDSIESLESFADRLTIIAEKVRERGLVFAFHPISPDYREMEGRMIFERLMELLPSHAQLTFCVNAAFNAGVDPAYVFSRYSGRIDLVHFKDDALQPDGTKHMTPLGQGEHDWQPILEMCKQHNVKYVFAEQERWLKDAFESINDSLQYLSSL